LDTFAQLESAFAALGGAYRSRKEAAEKLVLDWQWGTWRWLDILPLYFERHGFAPGRRLKQEPADRRNRVACGLDGDGRVVVERQFNEFGCYETFYAWTPASVEAAHFDYTPEKTPINLLHAKISNGRIVASDTAASNGYSRDEYRWDGDLVREVRVQHARREGGVLAPLRLWNTVRAFYNDDGMLQRVDLLWPASVVQRADDLVEIMFERRGNKIYRNHP
jgi:hypothetical protein